MILSDTLVSLQQRNPSTLVKGLFTSAPTVIYPVTPQNTLEGLAKPKPYAINVLSLNRHKSLRVTLIETLTASTRKPPGNRSFILISARESLEHRLEAQGSQSGSLGL